MPRCLAVAALICCLVGCSRYSSRGQGPFKKDPPPAPGYARQPGPPVNKSPLALNSPTQPLSPGVPDETLPVPPRPPEPGANGYAVNVPQTPRPPVVDPNVQPAVALYGGADPGIIRRRKTEPNPAALPSPFVPPGGGSSGGLPSPGSPSTPGSSAGLTPPGSPSTPGSSAGLTPPGSPNSSAPSPAAVNLAQLKKLVQAAGEKWKKIDTYEAMLTRREVVGEYQSPTEEVLFQFRKEPMSVFMRNVGETGKGREVVYNPGKFGDKMHISTGVGEGLYTGMKVTMTPDNPRVKEKSRQSIRDAGFGTTVGKFTGLVEKIESGKLPPDALRYLGAAKRPEVGELPLEVVEQFVRPGEEQLAKGGVRQWFFDAKPDSPSFGLPVLVILTESNGTPTGREIEFYCFTQFKVPANLTDADFDPARLKKK